MSAIGFALRYAALGWSCFPLRPREKVPATSHGVLDASTDPEELRRMFRDPRSNIGVACGASGLAVVDVDPRNGGNESLRELVAKHGRLPLTPRSRTGSGGAHVLYRAPVGVSLRAKLAPGVDLLRGNAYFVAPPSVHPNGRRYQWDLSALPSCTPVAPLPSWIVDLARVVEAPPVVRAGQPRASRDVLTRASRWLAACDPAVQGSNGSAALMHAVTGLVRGFCLDEGDALVLLIEEYNGRCRPPWRDRELLHALKSARRSPKALGYLLDVPRRCA